MANERGWRRGRRRRVAMDMILDYVRFPQGRDDWALSWLPLTELEIVKVMVFTICRASTALGQSWNMRL